MLKTWAGEVSATVLALGPSLKPAASSRTSWSAGEDGTQKQARTDFTHKMT